VRRTSAVDWRGLALFETIALALVFLWVGIARGTGLLADQRSAGLVAWIAQPTVLAAAVAARRLRPGLPRMTWSIGGPREYAAVLAGAAALAVLAAGLPLGFGFTRLVAAEIHILSIGLSGTIFFIVASLFALGEEFGWRGLLLPALLPAGPLAAGLMTVPFWFTWELPLVAAGVLYPAMGAANLGIALLLHLVLIASLALVLAYVRLSSGSVILCAAAHGALNTAAGISSAVLVPTDPIWGDPAGPVGTAILACVACVFALRLRRLAVFRANA
jgi:membrane protease YdiL (CAAX protease family)